MEKYNIELKLKQKEYVDNLVEKKELHHLQAKDYFYYQRVGVDLGLCHIFGGSLVPVVS